MAAHSLNTAPDEAMLGLFLRHTLVGLGAGVVLGALVTVGVLMWMRGLQIEIPALYLFALLANAGVGGGLLGSAIFMARISRVEPGDDSDSGLTDRHLAAPERARTRRARLAAPAPAPA